MISNTITSGRNVPEEINVAIEIPYHGDPVKYEVDKETGMMTVDRFMATAMHYPCNYGYIPHTLCDDGDPADVLVVTPVPLISGVVVRCRPVGVLAMTDEAGPDCKLLAVPAQKLTTMYDRVHEPSDLPRELLDQISHFFAHYKDLESGKWVRIEGWYGAEAARKEILEAVARYKGARVKPNF
ncbi:MAG: inorganic diphosphatase [Nitrococcus mobilis]|nr:inorganic diphosphatase [Nitrococcus mobilis]